LSNEVDEKISKSGLGIRSFLLFSKERVCDHSLNRSLKKSKCPIALFVALCKTEKKPIAIVSLF